MRIIPLLLIAVFLASTVIITRLGVSLFSIAPPPAESAPWQPALSMDWISDVQRYDDRDYDFSMAVPAGWQPIITIGGSGAAHSESSADEGYAVGFEAPRDSAGDSFADYVLVEILPGTLSGRFLTDGTRAGEVRIAGLQGVRESLAIDGHDMGFGELDLMVHQAEVRGTGFTIGFYAIGEPSRRALLDDAFELMIRTFDLHRPPFRIS